jgi:hypothetical protein
MWRLVVATGMWQKHAECEHPHHYTLKTNMKLPNIGFHVAFLELYQYIAWLSYAKGEPVTPPTIRAYRLMGY